MIWLRRSNPIKEAGTDRRAVRNPATTRRARRSRPTGTQVLMATLALAVGCSHGAKTAQGPPAAPVTVATTVQKDMPVVVNAIGAVRAYSTVQVKSRVDGQLAQVGFKQGDEVQKDQLIFTIDPRPFDAALAQAQGFLDRDTASLKSAEADWQRTKELENTKAMSATAVDQARAKADSLRATVAADVAAVDNAKLQLAYCYIRSPIDGRIGLLLVNEGNIVKNSDSVLATINQLRPIYVDFSVPEQELPRIRRHMSQGSLGVEEAFRRRREAVGRQAGRVEQRRRPDHRHDRAARRIPERRRTSLAGSVRQRDDDPHGGNQHRGGSLGGDPGWSVGTIRVRGQGR